MKARYSIVDRELVMAAAPPAEHQRCLLELALNLTPVVREHRLGQVLIAPSDIVLHRHPLIAQSCKAA
jgi:hypothetical protein